MSKTTTTTMAKRKRTPARTAAMGEVDVIGLQHYDAFYMQKAAAAAGQQPLLACLSLKQNTRRHSDNAWATTGLVRVARIYFTGDLICSPAMLQVFKNEAIECTSGFPSSVSSLSVERTGSFARATDKVRPATTTTTTTCKVIVSASELRGALRTFMVGDDYELVRDEMKTRGNGLGFRAIHHEGNCVALLYLLRDNVMLTEQPLFGTHAAGGSINHGIGPSPSLFVLDVTVMRTFMGLSNDVGTVELAFKECHETGGQRGTLAYHRKHESGCTDDVDGEGGEENSGPVFTVSFSLTPVGT